MPFIDERPTPQNLIDIAPSDEPDGVDPALGDTFGAAFRTQNVIGSWLASRGTPDPYQIEDGFDAIDYVKDDPKYSPYVDKFAGVFNKKSADAMKLQIDREEADRRTLDAAGKVGVIAQMAAGVIDLPTLLPVGGALASEGRLLSIGARAALGAGVDAGVSEAGLQATQATRTAQESALNVGGSIVLGGALGTLAGRYLSGASQLALSRKIEGQAKAFEDFDRGFSQARSASAQSAGAAARDVGPLKLKDEELISKLPVISRQDPLIRLQLGELDTGREVVRQLAETPLEYADNARGVATEIGGSVETRVKMWNAPLAKGLREIDTEFARYFHDAPEPSSWQIRLSPARSEFERMRGGQKMTYKQFKEEVGRAAYMDGKHEIPEVANAARVYRRIDEDLKRAAIDAGLFAEDVTVAGDISHRFRVYNKERIIANRTGFKKILSDYFQSKQEAAAFKAEEIRLGDRIANIERMRDTFSQAFDSLNRVEERLAARAGVRRGKVENLDQARQTRFDVMKERAPEALVKALRNADETAPMVDAVKEARANARSADAKRSFANDKPVLAIIREKGGVRIGSVLDGELRAMGVTPKTIPGLFRKRGGIGDVDNFVKSEYDIFDGLPDDGSFYANRVDVLDAIRSELAGSPLRSAGDIAAESMMDNIDRVASEWLDSVGLPDNATVKDVRDHIRRVIGAENNLADLDSRISRMEAEIDRFDEATDTLRNDREISAQEAATISRELEDLEAGIDDVSDLANASPTVSIIVDRAKTRRDLFKAKLKERSLKRRFDAIEELDKAGRANERLQAEMAAKKVDLERLDKDIKSLSAKADKLDKMAPARNAADSADEFANLSRPEIESLADEVIDNILGHAEGRIPYDIVAGPRGALKERVLKIETAKIHDFVENDIEHVLHAQMRTMSADIELAKKFGSVDLKEQIRKVNDEANARIDKAATVKERQSLEKARKDAIRDIEGIRDRLRGTYALPSNPASLVLRAGRVARNVNYLRLLGGMTISAIPDMAKVVFTHGLISTFRDGFIPMVRNFRAFRLAADEVKMAGTALDMVLDSRTMAMADIMDDFGRHSKFERGLKALSSKFGVVSLMAPWNAAMKQFSGLVTMTNILKASERVAVGKGTPDDIRKLAAAGIDEDLAQRIARQFAEHGSDQDGVRIAGGVNWTDRGALEAFRAAVVRDVDRIVVTPGQDKPLWMSTELGKAVGQFKTFGVSSMQKTMLAGLQQRDAATLNGTMLALGLGAFTYWAKMGLAGRETSNDPTQWAVEALDKSGLVGWLMDVNNIAEKASRGRVGFSAITGKQVSRYSSRNVTGAFLGPTADAISDIFQVSGSIFAGDMTKSDLHRARQFLPAQNLFYVRGLLNQVEEATGDALGLPETRQ